MGKEAQVPRAGLDSMGKIKIDLPCQECNFGSFIVQHAATIQGDRTYRKTDMQFSVELLGGHFRSCVSLLGFNSVNSACGLRKGTETQKFRM
jgi:hypothetical protein